MAIGEAAHALDEEIDDAHEQKGDNEEEEEFGQVMFDERERVAVPSAQDIGKVQIILRKRVWKAL